MTEVLSTLFNLSVLIFVLTSMFGLGLSLKPRQVFEPMKDASLIAKALLANFVLAPLLAFFLARVIGLDRQSSIALFILSVAAGAPMMVKYSELAKGDPAYTLCLTVLLQVITIVFAPLVLPLLLEGIQVNTWGMLKSLVFTMLIPLVAGLFIKARYDELAQSLIPYMSQSSSFTLMAQVVLGLLLGGQALPWIIGTGGILAMLLFIAGALVLGYLLGGPARETRVVTGLGTAQRNVTAAMLITIQNFPEPQVLIMVLTGATLMIIINSLIAAELGKRASGEK